MRLDGLTLRELSKEVGSVCVGLRVEKVASAGEHAILIGFQKGSNVLVSSHPEGARVSLIDSRSYAKTDASSFIMLLRKHLDGGKLVSVNRKNLENAVELWFKSWDDEEGARPKLLLLEATGAHSNLFLLDSEGMILGVLKKVPSMRAGSPGQRYEPLLPFEMPDALECTKAAFVASAIRKSVAKPGISTMHAISGGLYGISGEHASDLIGISGYRGDVVEEAAAAAYEALRSKQEKHGSSVWPGVTVEGPKGKRVSLILSENGESPSACIERLIGGIEASEQVTKVKAALLRVIDSALRKAEGKLESRMSELEESRGNEVYRIWADAILSSLNELKGPLPKRASLHDYSSGLEKLIDVPLDDMRSATGNAEEYYRLYNKGKRAQKALTQLIEAAESELDYLRTVKDACQRAETGETLEQIRFEMQTAGLMASPPKARQQKSKSSSAPAQYTLSTGHIALVGRNNFQNDELTFRIAQPHDLWFHVKGAPGSHVILRLERNEKPSDAALMEVAKLAAINSSSRGGFADVDFTEVRRVKKIKGGQPGAVTYTDQKTIAVRV